MFILDKLHIRKESIEQRRFLQRFSSALASHHKKYVTCFYIAFSLILLLVSGCQPAVRFTSNQIPEKNQVTKSANEFSYKSVEIPPDRILLLTEAESWLGTSYKYGGNDREGIDCSGFVKQVFSSNGIKLPRTAAEQYQVTLPLDDSERKPGDLLFFQKSGKINHVGIYLGGGEMIHASTSRGVIKQQLDSYEFGGRYAGARRIKELASL